MYDSGPGGRCQPFEKDQRPVMTGGADAEGDTGERFHPVTIVGCCGCCATGGSGRRRGAEELSAADQFLAAMTSAEEALVADAVKARGEDVEQKTLDEFARGERHGFR